MRTKKSTSRSTGSPKAAYVTVVLLMIFTLLAVSARILIQQSDEFPSGDSAWSIHISNQVEALDRGATISISPPWDTRHARLFAQSISHTGLRQKRVKSDLNKRDIVLVAPRAGIYVTEVEYSVHVSSLARSEPKKSKLSENNRSQWLSGSTGVQINTPVTTKIVDRLSEASTSSEELIDKLFGHVSNNIRIDHRAGSESELALTKKRATALGSSSALVALLRTAHLPARIVTGVNLQATAAEQPYYWVEVYDAEAWVPLDPAHGYLRQLPAYYIPLRKGDSVLVIPDRANIQSTAWRIDSTHAPATLLTSDEKKLTDILDLDRLSPASRENLGVLLLLPLGVLATEIMRQLIGVRTYGTFTPTLMALAVIHVDRTTAIIIFLLVTIIGISIRSYLPNLNLQRTPLLAIVFTLVAISMALVVSAFMYFDPGMDGIIVLLPVVVLTMLVDRIYSIADQRGMRTAMIRLFWTVVCSFIALLVLLQADWSLWLVSYPELHAITLAIVIAIGMYQGQKLSELPALSWLREPDLRKTRKTDKAAQSEQSGSNL